ncbi:MAG: histidinol-phosphate transaminase [Gammaproteobacteria bacterium]|nr:histidinol-phosphate transaminase [Gammaproteobacteria bacterium]MDH5172769.1 histidinol-phosphate transaminase [Gammaproteobacteria bacterium]
MSRYWSDVVRQLTPYIPGEQPRLNKLVKLNTNEHPYPPSPLVLDAIASVTGEELRRYPDPESTELRRAFARCKGLQPEQVFLGNGSDEVLAHVFQALLRHEHALLFPDVTYSFYPVWCDLYQVCWRAVPLAPDFRVDPADYRGDNGGIIIPNPNAPTGVLLGLAGVRQILEQNPASVVVIDEAYIDFGGESAVSLIPEFDNLLVVQTMSKSWALAGLRVGVAMGSAELIDGLQRVKNSFNSYPLDVLAQRAAVAALADDDYFRQACQRVVKSRERLTAAMGKLGFEVLPSAANFILARHPGRAARELFAALRARGIIVRYFDRPRIEEYLRITIGTDEQCDELLAALGELLA